MLWVVSHLRSLSDPSVLGDDTHEVVLLYHGKPNLFKCTEMFDGGCAFFCAFVVLVTIELQYDFKKIPKNPSIYKEKTEMSIMSLLDF